MKDEKFPNLENRMNQNHWETLFCWIYWKVELSAVKEQKEETTLSLEWWLACLHRTSPSSLYPIFSFLSLHFPICEEPKFLEFQESKPNISARLQYWQQSKGTPSIDFSCYINGYWAASTTISILLHHLGHCVCSHPNCPLHSFHSSAW